MDSGEGMNGPALHSKKTVLLVISCQFQKNILLEVSNVPSIKVLDMSSETKHYLLLKLQRKFSGRF